MHSNLIYSAFDPRFNVVSLPFLFDSVEDADAKLDGEAGEKLKEILDEYGLHCMGIAENGFRQLTNSKQEVKSVDDMKNLKIRVAGSNLLMECYKRWGADATNMNWSETYTAPLQQKTVEGQENPLPAIDAASVQEVQPYCSMWNAIYDCLFFCILAEEMTGYPAEQDAFHLESLEEQKKVWFSDIGKETFTALQNGFAESGSRTAGRAGARTGPARMV